MSVSFRRGIDRPLERLTVVTCSACRRPTWIPKGEPPVALCETCAAQASIGDAKRRLTAERFLLSGTYGKPPWPSPTQAGALPPPPPPARRESFWAKRRRQRRNDEARKAVSLRLAETLDARQADAAHRADRAAIQSRFDAWDDEESARIAFDLRSDLAAIYPTASDADLDGILNEFRTRTRDLPTRPRREP